MEAIPQNDPDDEPTIAAADDSQQTTGQGCFSCSPQRLVCVSHTFSAWGDRMWEFAVALYLVELTPGSLRLTAVFQLVRTLCTIFLGPFVGNWVDGNPRLHVARLSLLVQNIAVATSALLLLLILSVHLSPALFAILVCLVILVACLSVLAGIATKISIEKDWIVVICGGDKAVLAGANAILRRIDLVCKLLAPVLVGQIMTYVSKKAGVILIAVWNVTSVFFEYYMLIKVFQAVPALSIKKIDKNRLGEETNSSLTEEQGSRDRLDWMERENNQEQDDQENDRDMLVPQTTIRQPSTQTKPSVFQRIKTKAKTLKVGCQIYMRQSVVLPGLSLACLYFTVLSFGSITTGYIYTQNISESILSILRGVGSVFGILATFVFPKMRNSLGLVRSGLFSMSAQFICMGLCLIAIFCPGSPFMLLPDSFRFYGSTEVTHHIHNVSNCSVLTKTAGIAKYQALSHKYFDLLKGDNNTLRNDSKALTSTLSRTFPISSAYLPTKPIQDKSIQHFNVSSVKHNKTLFSTVPLSTSVTTTTSSLSTVKTTSFLHTSTSIIPSKSATLLPSSISPSFHPTIHPTPSARPAIRNCTVDEVSKKTVSHNFSYVSVVLIITGIILSRFGLWLSDLCITQLQQENVPEEERGIVGAMQKTFNSILDMSMYIFVIALPKAEEFGFMGIMSVAAVATGGIMYTWFSYKSRGHLFHFDKIKRVLVRSADRNSAPTNRSSSRENLTQEDEEEDEMLNEVLTTRNENFSES